MTVAGVRALTRLQRPRLIGFEFAVGVGGQVDPHIQAVERRHYRITSGRVGVIDRGERQDLASQEPRDQNIGDIGAVIGAVVVGQVLAHQVVSRGPRLDLADGRGLGHSQVLAGREGAVPYGLTAVYRQGGVWSIAEHLPLGDPRRYVDRVLRRDERRTQIAVQIVNGQTLASRFDGLAAALSCRSVDAHAPSFCEEHTWRPDRYEVSCSVRKNISSVS